ncbi:MAG: class F sortase [Christensenellales bacterium]
MLWNVKEGQGVAIEREDGSVLYFRVTSVDFYPYNDYPESVMDMESGRGEDDADNLLHGDFDRSAGTSEQRCVVVCELITDGTENEPAAE